MIKEYSNGEITILWQPEKCIHAGECVKALPQVYNPKEKPWIKIDNASSAELRAQVALCPSGALSIKGQAAATEVLAASANKVEIIPNGPLLVYGDIKVCFVNGTDELKHETTAFCRCGASSNKPYCDGTHSTSGFKD